MNLLKSFVDHRNKIKEELNENCDNLILEVEDALNEIEIFFKDKNEYIDPLKAHQWKNKNELLKFKLKQVEIKKLKKANNYKVLLKLIENYDDKFNNIETDINKHNDDLAKRQIKEAYNLIGNVEGRRLDEQQMTCIVKDVSNHIVIAGAGTGKTTTIVGKIKYLLKSEKLDYKDILVLSFTNASASEMSERIKKETGYPVEAITFHKLGLNILNKVEGKVPNISNLDLRKFIKQEIEKNIKNDKYLNILNKYFLFSRVKAKNEFEFESLIEYNDWLKYNAPITLKKENVKSYGEMVIANYLLMNGINYEYEKSYCIDTRDENHGQYHPDFYLPDYDIYIEYFGVNRENNVPDYFENKEEYIEGMVWKRNVHNENNTILIECYAYEHLEGMLEECLKDKLIKNLVELKPLTPEELYEILAKENEGILTGLISLFVTLINLIKSNDYSIDTVRKLNETKANKDSKMNKDLLYLLEPIFNAYNQLLINDKTIDFNDMINKATKYVKEGKYLHDYKCVIVDEYQDISKARFNLLKSLRDSKDYSLFCVGDDWQSIYRFSGSDIDYITHFSNHWGTSQISKIETTYRFNQSLINISGKFVTKNENQIKKILRSQLYGHDFALGSINGYTDSIIVSNLVERLNDLPKDKSVFFLGRYNHDVHIFDKNPLFRFNYDNVNKVVRVKYVNRPDLQITYLTAHTSKGLQADYVFILNNKDSIMGFPSRIEDSSLVDLLLEGSDNYPFAEERRLFYVALTRARIKTFILTKTKYESIFAKELMDEYKDELRREYFTCPNCGGKLYKKEGKYGTFYGCSNYKELGCKYTRKCN